MAVDQTGQHDAVLAVERFAGAVAPRDLLARPDSDDETVVDRDRAVLEHRPVTVHGDHVVAGDDQVDGGRVAVAVAGRGAAGRERRESEKCRRVSRAPSRPGRHLGLSRTAPERHPNTRGSLSKPVRLLKSMAPLTFSSSGCGPKAAISYCPSFIE